MVIAARRAYLDAVRWTVEARPDIHPPLTARRILAASLCAGTLLMGSIGLLSPSSFGDPAASRSGWQWWLLGGVTLLAALALASRVRVWLRPLRYRPPEEGVPAASDALISAGAPFRTRYSVSWLWIPALTFASSTVLAIAGAYFLVDAIVARFSISWHGPTIGLFDIALAYALLMVAAPRIWTLRFAGEVLRAARDQS